ncbi:MAG: hypothetical protein QW724_06655 [Nitrososphaerota archaeon]
MVTIYDVDDEVIRLASKIKAEALLKGEEIYDVDLMIAVSGTQSLTIWTANNVVVIVVDGNFRKLCRNYMLIIDLRLCFCRRCS